MENMISSKETELIEVILIWLREIIEETMISNISKQLLYDKIKKEILIKYLENK